ncbi:hypothetical protein PC129_g3663 [Phytophthora cactorum]|uniref:Uncharacterized protein n=1 Tax=Phytophthora cactorum TaxID=29920 RepID=A0A8T1DKV3_9STRA|nr:hypothetical protein PC112_g4782 [Phytophthora cactorum]KAG2841738.1 hypothetical protein PC111_g3006 [Phytophthora cactorum]KAG2923181.1 hypothetical protein PC114_g4914 [Phytophthora cactorum]KAG2939632.1 hypothetical protein PC115_g2983 [Phytophthora cactorum]KAG2949896.1 hypothetical protein PC117_g4901 [Phytophthora cactorum]
MLTPDKLSSSFLFLRSLRSSVTPTPFSGASVRPIPGARPLTLRPRVLQVPNKKNNIPGFSDSDSSFVGFVRSCTSAERQYLVISMIGLCCWKSKQHRSLQAGRRRASCSSNA